MPFPIKPGKATCVGLVAIMMVLPSSIWKGDSARASVRVPVKSESKKTR